MRNLKTEINQKKSRFVLFKEIKCAHHAMYISISIGSKNVLPPFFFMLDLGKQFSHFSNYFLFIYYL